MDDYSDDSFHQWLAAIVQKVRTQTKSISRDRLEGFQPDSFVEACTGLAALSTKGYTQAVLGKWVAMLLKQLSSPEIHRKLPYALDVELFQPLQADHSAPFMDADAIIRRLPKCSVCQRIATRFTINTSCKCIACYKCAKASLMDSMLVAQGKTTSVPCFGCSGLLRNITWSVTYYERLITAKVQCHDSNCTFVGTISEYCEHSLNMHQTYGVMESHNASMVNSSFVDVTQYEESAPQQQRIPYMFGAYGNDDSVVPIPASSLVQAQACEADPAPVSIDEQPTLPPQNIPLYSADAIRKTRLKGKGKGTAKPRMEPSSEVSQPMMPAVSASITPAVASATLALHQPPSNMPPPMQFMPPPAAGTGQDQVHAFNNGSPVLGTDQPTGKPLGQSSAAPPPTKPPILEVGQIAPKRRTSSLAVIISGIIVGIIVSQILLYFTPFGSIFPSGYDGILYLNRL